MPQARRVTTLLLSAGGRVLGVTALAGTFEAARAGAYAAVDAIHFSNRIFRRDIAREAVNHEHRAHAGSSAARRTRGATS